MTCELIDNGDDRRFVRRDKDGQFKESDNVGRSLAEDQKHDAKPSLVKGTRGIADARFD